MPVLNEKSCKRYLALGQPDLCKRTASFLDFVAAAPLKLRGDIFSRHHADTIACATNATSDTKNFACFSCTNQGKDECALLAHFINFWRSSCELQQRCCLDF
jgi:hypothetical protein